LPIKKKKKKKKTEAIKTNLQSSTKN